MKLTLKVLGKEAPVESRNLLAWLRADETLGARANLARLPPAPDEMGTLDEALTLALDPASIAAVASALATWLTTRRRAVELHLKHGDRELKLTAGSPADARKLLTGIENLLTPQNSAADSDGIPSNDTSTKINVTVHETRDDVEDS